MKVKIGIVGCGAVAYRWYLSGLLKNSNKEFEVSAVCDINESRAKRASKDFNIPNYFTKIEDLANSNIDLVVILTRHSDHFEHIKFFLNKGIHAYSEKPFASTKKECIQLIKLAEKKNLTLSCAPQIMLSSRNQKVKKMLEKKVIGKISYIRASCSNLGPANRKDTNYDPRWFYNEGGSIWSLGIYGLSTLVWWFGKPKIIVSLSTISFENRMVKFGPCKGEKFRVTADDNTIALFDFGDDSLAVFDGSYSMTTPPKYEFEIHGELGSIFVGGFGGLESILLQKIDKKPIPSGPRDNCHINWTLAWGVIETAKAIKEKREPLTNVGLAADVIEVIEKMKLSSVTKKFIQL